MRKLGLIFIAVFPCASNADIFCPEVKDSDWPKAVEFSDKDINCTLPLGTLGAPEGLAVDLNGDGLCEYINMFGSGSGAHEHTINTFVDGKLVNLGMYQTWSIRPTEKING